VEQQPRVQQFVDSLRSRQVPGVSPTIRAPMSTVISRPATPTEPIFDPQMLNKLGQLEVIARTVVDGFLSGKHRSTHKGGCTDFAEYRPYAPGDDIRQLDWKKFAKTDRYYVKRYDDETNMQALIIVDSSGSMQFGMSTVSKWRYAQMAAACLGHLLLRQRDSVGLAVIGERLIDYVKPQPRANHLSRVIKVLEHIQASGKSQLDESLQGLTGRLKRRGMVILISDCFGDVNALRHVLEQFRLRGHDVLVVQVLAPEELSFPFKRESFFQDLELPRRMQVNPNTLRKQYLAEFRSFLDQLHQTLTDVGADHVTLRTDQDLGEILAQYLHRRAAQKKATLSRSR
jgi:uncharacterized protein (DUF58 family)